VLGDHFEQLRTPKLERDLSPRRLPKGSAIRPPATRDRVELCANKDGGVRLRNAVDLRATQDRGDALPPVSVRARMGQVIQQGESVCLPAAELRREVEDGRRLDLHAAEAAYDLRGEAAEALGQKCALEELRRHAVHFGSCAVAHLVQVDCELGCVERSLLSERLANLVLDPFDRLVMNKLGRFHARAYRYVDDILVIAKSRKDALLGREIVTDQLRALNYQIKPGTGDVCDLRDAQNPLGWLGYAHSIPEVSVLPKAVLKFVAKLQAKYDNGVWSRRGVEDAVRDYRKAVAAVVSAHVADQVVENIRNKLVLEIEPKRKETQEDRLERCVIKRDRTRTACARPVGHTPAPRFPEDSHEAERPGGSTRDRGSNAMRLSVREREARSSIVYEDTHPVREGAEWGSPPSPLRVRANDFNQAQADEGDVRSEKLGGQPCGQVSYTGVEATEGLSPAGQDRDGSFLLAQDGSLDPLFSGHPLPASVLSHRVGGGHSTSGTAPPPAREAFWRVALLWALEAGLLHRAWPAVRAEMDRCEALERESIFDV